jgi:hypothetical protein
VTWPGASSRSTRRDRPWRCSPRGYFQRLDFEHGRHVGCERNRDARKLLDAGGGAEFFQRDRVPERVQRRYAAQEMLLRLL